MKVLPKLELPENLKKHYTTNRYYEDWTQGDVKESDVRWFEKVYKSQVKLPKLREYEELEHTTIAHVFTGRIPEHDDNMCTKTMLIPLKLTEDVVFYCGKSKVKLQEGVPVVFNDNQKHRVECSNKKAKQVVISIDYKIRTHWF